MITITVAPYDPLWRLEFEKIRAELAAALGDDARIEHVGSTSVPDLAAKPTIDIDVVIAAGEFRATREKLEGIGYTHRGDYGIRGREAFHYDGKRHLMRHNLYVCASDSSELARHLALRDWLRAHDDDRDEYARVKTEGARLYPHDIDAYIAHKQAFILGIYRKVGVPCFAPKSYDGNEHFMSIALAFARRTADYGETPVGAVVVSPDGKILGHGHNRREGLRDIASHAEIEAMRNAANAVGDWRLTDCSLYVTLEPCPMCAGAIIAARVSRVFYGARDENGGAVSGNLNMFVEFGGGTEVTGGVLADECGAVLSEFFRGMRNPV